MKSDVLHLTNLEPIHNDRVRIIETVDLIVNRVQGPLPRKDIFPGQEIEPPNEKGEGSHENDRYLNFPGYLQGLTILIRLQI
jgi:hypothetical protein